MTQGTLPVAILREAICVRGTSLWPTGAISSQLSNHPLVRGWVWMYDADNYVTPEARAFINRELLYSVE